MKIISINKTVKKTIFVLMIALFGLTACRTGNLTKQVPNPTAAPSVGTDDNIKRPRSEPYTGDLSIFEDPQRAENLQIDRVMNLLKISAGKSVADIGAGSGWFSVRAAKRVGTNGKVFAVELNQEYINYINERAAKENFSNIQTVLGTEDDPKLPDNAVDAVLILKTYHEIGQPIKVLKNLKKSLKKDALIGIIDRSGNGDDHGIKAETVIGEMKQAGFALENQYDFVKPDGMDYFLVFK